MGVTADETWASMVTVGRIARPHGHRGQVVIVPETDFGEQRFAEGAVVFALRAGVVVPLTASREFNGRWIVGFDRIPTMNDAETFRGQELRIDEADLQALDAGQFYVHDLVGCRVETVAGQVAGTVTDVHVGPAAPILTVRTATGEALVPFVDAICRRVDLAAKLIVIDPPDGLL
jgi:16S rRNA processing protein RimM